MVPANFETDLASVPRFPLTWLLSGGRADAAAVLHDWLYRSGCKFKQIKTREEADDVFLEAMQSTGVPRWPCLAMYHAVKQTGCWTPLITIWQKVKDRYQFHAFDGPPQTSQNAALDLGKELAKKWVDETP